MDSKKNIDGLKILLLQIRENEAVRKEEHESFARYAGVDCSQIEIHNVFDKPNVPMDVAEGFDALFIGGASEASVLEQEKYPFIKPCINLIHRVIEKKTPTFASCFGFQLAVLALGGQIIRDKENFEMGTIPIQLTKEAKSDPLFSNIDDHFKAVSVHQEKAIETPAGCIKLAYTAECLHSFKVKRAPFWTFQFHPELDRPCLEQRLGVYKDSYTEDKSHFEKVIDSLDDTPESNQLVELFVKKILLGQSS